MKSNALKSVEQGQLALVRKAGNITVPTEIIFAQPSLLAAINLCINVSGLEEKEICLTLEIDPGHFNRIRKGDAHFPTDKIGTLMDLCGNEAPLQWLANSRGKGLVMLQSESERLLAEEREARLEVERENRYLKEFIRIK